MRRLIVLMWLGAAGLASAQESPLTLPDALGRARDRAAVVIQAAGRVDEARSRLLPAGRRFRENPAVELGAGRRQADTAYTDFEVAVSQAFEPAARRRMRLAGAGAAVATAEAELADVRRLYLGEVAAAFERTLAAQERLRLATQAETLATDLLTTAERRSEMGELTALELNRVRTAAARARAERSAAEGERLGAGGALRALLGMETGEALAVAGSPEALPAYELAPLLARAAERTDLQALDAALKQAEAEVLLAETLARPDFALRTGYQREEGADVVSAGITVSLPIFQKGQEEQATGRARAASLRTQLEAARRSAEAGVRARFEEYQRRAEAVQELEQTALPASQDNETLARRSFEVGEINLGELLLIRQEILETRLTHLNLLLEARLAAAELETIAGARP